MDLIKYLEKHTVHVLGVYTPTYKMYECYLTDSIAQHIQECYNVALTHVQGNLYIVKEVLTCSN